MKCYVLMALGVTLAIVGCATDTVPVAAVACTTDAECSGEQFCQNGVCGLTSGCLSETDCPQGYTCLADGRCQEATECGSDVDCCQGVVDCQLSCVQGACVGTQCASGESVVCFLECHKGAQACVAGVLQPCDAAQISAEICGDGVDNNCEGGVDEGCGECEPGAIEPCDAECGQGTKLCGEDRLWLPCESEETCECEAGESKACATECGPGIQFCSGEAGWLECLGPEVCTCEPGDVTSVDCTHCGHADSLCSPEGAWLPYGVCEGEGDCAAGEQEFNDCGNCGQQMRQCDDICQWGEFNKCGGEGSCAPDSESVVACGNCGSQVALCTEACELGEFGACQEGTGCSEGEVQTMGCGLCGEQFKTCDAACQWSEWGECSGEGVCTPGAIDDSEECGLCGERNRSCTDSCEWGAWGPCQGAGVCAPGDQDEQNCGPATDQGICQIGTQVQSCKANCQWSGFGSCLGATNPTSEICGNDVDEDCDGADWTGPGTYEPNDFCATCYDLGTDPAVILYPTIDKLSDSADYFCFYGDENETWAESVDVTVSAQPPGMDVDIYLWESVEKCQQGTSAAADSSTGNGGVDESLFWKEWIPILDDSHFFVIGVISKGSPSCDSFYTLEVSGLN